MTEPDIVNDTEKYLKLMRESSDLEPLYTTYKRYLEAVAGEKEALEMLASEKDPEMIELAKAELAEAKENQPTLIKELQILLLPKDENDDKNIIMEIRGGAGGDEAALFAAELYRMYINYAERRGYKTELMSVNETGIGGMNKTSSAVRLIHIPTGMVAECQEERSQLQNREKAMRLLRARLYEIEYNKKHDEAAEAKRSQVGTGDRSEKIRTYNFPQGRVTDHRIGLTLYSIDKVLNGDLDPLLDPIIAADQAAKLAELNQEVI